jgi:chromosomal replication initiator protein
MNLWNAVLLKLENDLPPEDFNTWLAPSTFVDHSNGRLTIRVPNKLFSNVIRGRFYEKITTTLSTIGAHDTELEVLEGEGNSDVIAAEVESAEDAPHHPALNPRYTFDTFVVGKSNELAHAAASSVVEDPGMRYNPLFLYGGVGLGKTHLMQAVGNAILHKNPGVKVAYVTSEFFMNELVSAIRFDRIHQFRSRYRSIDVLLIDDIQFIANKERTQEEFFHTFNALYDSRKQLIISSDCPPREIPTLEERLRSRFEWGLLADIQPPDLETKIAILQKKAELENADVPEEVMMLIASRVRSNIRELEGCLIRLVFYSSLTRKPIGIEMAKEALADLLEKQEKVITIRQIQERVANYYNISLKELNSRSNTNRIAYPRQVAMYLAKNLTNSSLPEIGKQFGGKHHSTVLHSIRKIEAKRKEDDSFNTQVNNFIESLT